MIVIGGGDTGTDCVGTSLRHGCKSLVQFEILPQPPTERAADNPWPQWPQGLQAGLRPGRSGGAVRRRPARVLRSSTKHFVGDDERQRQGAAHRRSRVGRRTTTAASTMKEIAGQREGLAGRAGAAGDGLPRPGEARPADRARRRSSTRAATSPSTTTSTTSVPGVFAAGDMPRGQSLIVWAIQEGRGAARGVDRYLMGETLLP